MKKSQAKARDIHDSLKPRGEIVKCMEEEPEVIDEEGTAQSLLMLLTT